MYGREKLVTYDSCELYNRISKEFEVGEAFLKDEVDKIMNAMERRIARLTALVEGWKKNSVVLGEMYHKRLEDVQNTMATENVDLGMENFKLKERIKELEATISKMETNQKWVRVKDSLPKEGEVIYGYGKFIEGLFVLQNKEWYTKEEYDDYAFEESHGYDIDAIDFWIEKPKKPTTDEK